MLAHVPRIKPTKLLVVAVAAGSLLAFGGTAYAGDLTDALSLSVTDNLERQECPEEAILPASFSDPAGTPGSTQNQDDPSLTTSARCQSGDAAPGVVAIDPPAVNIDEK